MSSLLKGTVRSYDAVTATAEVEIVGSHGRYVTVPVATHLDASVVTDGARCAILSFDEHNSSDAVLVATYDDTFGMGAGPLEDHDHTGDTGDGGQLEADEALLATGITDGYVLCADGADAVEWQETTSNPGAASKVLRSDADGYLTVQKLVAASGATGQSTIAAGLVVNNDGGSAEANDFVVKGDTKNLIETDAGDDALAFFGTTPAAQSTGWTVSNESSTKAFDANGLTLHELADVVGTLIEQLKLHGLLGPGMGG